MYYRSVDGKLFSASSNKELVSELKDASRTKTKTTNDYMKAVSRWCNIYNKAIIRYDNIDNFITDLLAYKILQTWSVL